MDGRRSPGHSTWKPHSELALQLLQGSTVWSCPVWLQTKHQRRTHKPQTTRLAWMRHSHLSQGATASRSDIPPLVWNSVDQAFPVSVFYVCTLQLTLVYACFFCLILAPPHPRTRSCGKCFAGQPVAIGAMYIVHILYLVIVGRESCRWPTWLLSGVKRSFSFSTCCPTALESLNTMKGFQLAPSLQPFTLPSWISAWLYDSHPQCPVFCGFSELCSSLFLHLNHF